MVNLSRRRLFARKTHTNDAVRLPWLAQPEQFTDGCTRCGKCIDVCETKIITKSDGGFLRSTLALMNVRFAINAQMPVPNHYF